MAGSRGLGRRALVVGGSISGLLAARVLNEFFDEVQIIERDRRPTGAAARKGIPQALHVHVLLRRGDEILEELFPGLIAELHADGAVQVDMLNRLPFYLGGWHASCPGKELRGVFSSRALLEWVVYERVRLLSRVSVREGMEVVRLLATSDGRGIRGAVVQAMRDRTEEHLEADFVVDASGRGSRFPRWLRDLGFAEAPVSEVSLPVRYATRTFRRRPSHGSMDGVIISSKPPGGRGGALFPIEGGQWMATLTGLDGDAPPSAGDDRFLEYARSLPTKEIFDELVHAEPTSAIAVYNFRSNLRRHYERCSPFPQNMAVIGDAACSLNPRFSQGMTIAAMEAVELRRVLRATDQDSLPRAGQRLARKSKHIVDLAWPGVVSADLLWPGARGELTTYLRFIQWYRGKIFLRTLNDSAARETFVRVTNFLEPPSRLYAPSFAARVLLPKRPISRKIYNKLTRLVAGRSPWHRA